MRDAALDRSQINQLVEIIEHPNVEKGGRHESGEHGADRQSVGARALVHVVCRFSAAAAGHVLNDDGGISRNVLAEHGNKRLCPQVSQSAGGCSEYNRNGFAFIKRGLRKSALDQR
jgi:hypothetical protein